MPRPPPPRSPRAPRSPPWRPRPKAGVRRVAPSSTGSRPTLPTGTDLQNLPLNTVSSPIAVNGNYLLIEITQRTPSSFAQARTEVESAVEAAGASKAGTIIQAAEKRANISVDRRYGEWVATQVLPPPSPPASDLLNPTVNGTVAASGLSS